MAYFHPLSLRLRARFILGSDSIYPPCAYGPGLFFDLIVCIFVLSCLLRATGVSVWANRVS